MMRRTLAAAVAAAALLTACGDDGDVEAVGPTGAPTESATVADDAGDDAAGTMPAAVALRLDGQQVPVATSCNGVDGAVLATTEGEVTISLVREEGIALRYQAEGFSAETEEVQVEEVGVSTVYRATLSSDDVEPVAVELEVADTSALEDC